MGQNYYVFEITFIKQNQRNYYQINLSNDINANLEIDTLFNAYMKYNLLEL